MIIQNFKQNFYLQDYSVIYLFIIQSHVTSNFLNTHNPSYLRPILSLGICG